MSKTLVGMVTFDNLEFTKLTVNSIQETSSYELDFYFIVGNPNDSLTKEWLVREGYAHKVHDINYGFPYSINDIYDYAWIHNDYDYIILVGNDVIAYPHCVDSLIQVADEYDYDCISALQLDVSDLIKQYSSVSRYFNGKKKIFTDFSATPWDVFTGYSDAVVVSDMKMHDIQNFCLYKKSLFEKVGYVDVNFYPAYFADNDYVRRLLMSDATFCTLTNARFFHFWSRTIHQSTGNMNTSKSFNNSKDYYIKKWGGSFGEETLQAPVLIDSRESEESDISAWMNKK